jgi:hypothetical protein
MLLSFLYILQRSHYNEEAFVSPHQSIDNGTKIDLPSIKQLHCHWYVWTQGVEIQFWQ